MSVTHYYCYMFKNYRSPANAIYFREMFYISELHKIQFKCCKGIKLHRRLASEEPNVPTAPPMSYAIPKLNPKPTLTPNPKTKTNPNPKFLTLFF